MLEKNTDIYIQLQYPETQVLLWQPNGSPHRRAWWDRFHLSYNGWLKSWWRWPKAAEDIQWDNFPPRRSGAPLKWRRQIIAHLFSHDLNMALDLVEVNKKRSTNLLFIAVWRGGHMGAPFATFPSPLLVLQLPFQIPPKLTPYLLVSSS